MAEEIKNQDVDLKDSNMDQPQEQNNTIEENYKQMSPMKLIFRRFFRSKLSIVGLVILVFLFLFAFLGPVIYNKWGETEVDRTQVAQIYTEEKKVINEYGEEIIIIQEIEIFTDNLKASPSKDHLLGTDEKGMDIFVRLMYGGRISLTIGFIVVILETIIGVILGGISGYFGGKVDQIIMRIVDVFNCIPMLPVLLIASAVLDAFSIAEIIDNSDRIYFLMLIITVFGWSGCARMVRGQILSLREQEFIVATEVMGIPTWRRIFAHLIPNVMPQLIVNMTLGLGSIILYESTLSYLGLGVQIPYAAWGTMISSSKNPEILSNYMNMWLPAGILIVLAVLGFNFVGDGLRDAMDPKSKK
jgi:peptide/nickel transport system permease protein